MPSQGLYPSRNYAFHRNYDVRKDTLDWALLKSSAIFKDEYKKKLDALNKNQISISSKIQLVDIEQEHLIGKIDDSIINKNINRWKVELKLILDKIEE